MPPHDIPGDLFHNHGSGPSRLQRPPGVDRPLRIGVGGPVGSGKTTLVGSLCQLLRNDLSLVVVTNDIFTSEDAEALRAAAVLPVDRIVAVETGCCPHTAIRDDIAANLDAVEQIERTHHPVDVTLVESGGDNLTAISKNSEAWASRGLWFVLAYLATESSTRRFFVRPSRVLLSAAGDSSP